MNYIRCNIYIYIYIYIYICAYGHRQNNTILQDRPGDRLRRVRPVYCDTASAGRRDPPAAAAGASSAAKRTPERRDETNTFLGISAYGRIRTKPYVAIPENISRKTKTKNNPNIYSDFERDKILLLTRLPKAETV